MSLNLEYGIVTAWDKENSQIRVKLHENGLHSFWLQVPQGYTKTTKRRCPVELGTEVAILLKDDGVSGILLGAVYSLANPPPVQDKSTDYIQYKDGSVIEYNPDSHQLNITLSQSATINITAPAGVTVNASSGMVINAEAGVQINANSGVSINASSGGTTIKGGIAVEDGDVIVNGVSFLQHLHSGVRAGSDSTGKPM